MQGFFKVLLFFVCVVALSSEARDVECSKEALRQKNCLLKSGKGQYQFLRDNLSIDDGVWKEVVKVPLEEEGTQWQSLRMIKRAGRRFYELKIWSPQKQDVKLQSLHWTLIELVGTKATLRLNQVIQKRRPIPNKKDGFLMDKMEKHTLKAKGSRIHWTVGHLKGDF